MILISHRANTHGPNTAYHGENHPTSIADLLNKGIHVEIDVWLIDGQYALGHDKPEYEIDTAFFVDRLWCHAKNLYALHSLMSNDVHCFFHDTDAATITSEGWIWTYPGQNIISSRAIAVMPERIEGYEIGLAGGVCSDYINNYMRVE